MRIHFYPQAEKKKNKRERKEQTKKIIQIQGIGTDRISLKKAMRILSYPQAEKKKKNKRENK